MSAESIFVASMEGNVVDANEAALKMFEAINRSDLIGKGVLDLIAPEDHEKAFENIKSALEGEKLNPVEYCIVKGDGSRALVELSASTLMGGDGKPTGFVAVGHDITERKRIEEALRQSEQSYRVLLESTHDSIIVVDAETFKITFGNRRASMMFGFDPILQDGIGVNLLDFVHPEDREIAIKGFVEDLYQAERRRRYDVRAKTQDDREIWISALGTRIEFQGRIAVLLSLRDITERKRMEEEKQKMEEQLLLAGRLAAVGELAAGVAHELNNPIAAIKGFAQFLKARKDLDETIRKDLDTIYRESQRAAKITQNLLSFARRHEPEKHPISINDVIENILEMQDHLMKVNNIELEVELDPDLPKTMADFHQMQQVFMNIVNNAEQAMLETPGKGRLLIKTQRSGKMVQISFADNGPGISEENLKRIFDPFFTTKEVGKGTGLGLSICYGLVEAHGGRIYARSKLGEGATVVVEMPIVSQNQLVAEAALLNPSSRGAK
jgi:two-component system NtrC family sensor kinase